MIRNRISQLNPWSCLALLLGFIAFMIVTGGSIVLPGNTDWLAAGDPKAFWLGWEFFRHTPILQWPLGASPEYGMALSSSIVFTDSIPLLAFLFKPFSPLLPEPFQYFGLWIALCFCLQTWFAWKLLTFFTANRWLPLLGCLFFAFAPVALWRVGGHFALFGHWLLLAGLCLYFSRRFYFLRWLGLLTAVTLVHAYLLAMVFTIYLAELMQRYWLKQLGIVKALGCLGVAAILVGFLMWAAGYFMLESGAGIEGFDVYRMNILSLIDPRTIWSQLLPDMEGLVGDLEGFMFLGIGMLGLGLLVAHLRFRDGRLDVSGARKTPLVIISVGLFLYAVTNNAYFGSDRILAYDLPPFMVPLTEVFRVPGRFFWPVYYLIYLAIFYSLFKRLKPAAAIALCAVLFALQMADSRYGWEQYRNKYKGAAPWESPLQSAAWDELATRYRKVILVPPANNPDNLLPVALFAALNRMAINAGHFARVEDSVVSAQSGALGEAVIGNTFEADSLYIFQAGSASNLWNLAADGVGESDVAAVVDGVRLLAPGYGNCHSCNQSVFDQQRFIPDFRFGYRGDRLSFAPGEAGAAYLLYGWGEPALKGTWSIGDTAALLLRLDRMPFDDLYLTIEGEGFVRENHTQQSIDILANGEFLGALHYDLELPIRTKKLKIPLSLLQHSKGELLLRFEFTTAVSPAELDMSADARRLAFGLRSLVIEEKSG